MNNVLLYTLGPMNITGYCMCVFVHLSRLQRISVSPFPFWLRATEALLATAQIYLDPKLIMLFCAISLVGCIANILLYSVRYNTMKSHFCECLFSVQHLPFRNRRKFLLLSKMNEIRRLF